ncbi:hypothetical protein LWI29_007448 [Acer saccharum]|uniref:Uncharacterized protein n=1 Tax=Acer saccharum TaxID=4024 RepID=A0AA39RK35_ACESA|nr:hypothetical protein LWI29_007448 [Acer saccharum]
MFECRTCHNSTSSKPTLAKTIDFRCCRNSSPTPTPTWLPLHAYTTEPCVELESMGLDRIQVIRVTMYFGNKPHQLHTWNDLNDSYKQDFVKAILDE